MEVSIREMKNHLSKYLKLAQAGKDVVITDRGRPVARLTLIKPKAEEGEAEVIERIKAAPWIRAGKGGPIRGSAKPIKIKRGEKTLARIVSELRD